MQDIQARAIELNRSSFVFDTHNDTLMRVVDQEIDLGVRLNEGHIDIPRIREGGTDALIFACYTSPDLMPHQCATRALKMVDAMYKQIELHPNDLELALTTSDIERVTHAGKIAAVLAIEGGHTIEDDLGILRMFYKLGVRSMTLTHFNNNNWADGSAPEQTIPNHGGLTDFGREVIREMDRLRMLIDISHAADSTFWHVMETSKRPVIASHSDAYALNSHHRNLKDDQIKAIAERRGVIGANYYAGFLSSKVNDEMEAMRKSDEYKQIQEEFKDDRRGRAAAMQKLYQKVLSPVPLSVLIDHIDYIVKLVGPDYVGLGSDFDGISAAPQDLEDISKVPAITAALLERGYSDEDIKKILGANWLRVFREVLGE